MTNSPILIAAPARGSSCLLKCLIAVVLIALVLGGLWWWSNRPIQPVVLTAPEKAAVEAKVVAIQQPAEPKYEKGAKEIIITERELNGLLNERLARARKVLMEKGKAEYDLHAKAICSDVRILVERLVEDTLLNEVVRRFRRAVHTQNKIGGLAKIKPEDCQMIDELMTKYSRYEHSQPNEAPVALPEPDDIAADLTRLQAWLKEFSERKIPQPSAANILVSSDP